MSLDKLWLIDLLQALYLFLCISIIVDSIVKL